MPILRTATCWRPKVLRINACSSHASGRTPISYDSSKRQRILISDFRNKRWKRRDPERTRSGFAGLGLGSSHRESAQHWIPLLHSNKEFFNNLPLKQGVFQQPPKTTRLPSTTFWVSWR